MTPPTAEKKQLFTVVTADVCSEADLVRRIETSWREHGETLQAYHNVWYNAGHTWHMGHFCGVGMLKAPNDIWTYHELIWGQRPVAIIETGTYKGGSALWFAFLMDVLGITDGHIWTIDIEDYRDPQAVHPRITFLGGDSTDPMLRDVVAEALPATGPRLIVLDADHSAAHVYQELTLWAPLARVGDWIVVEDTNIGWPDIDRGARGGLEDYWREHPGEFRQDRLSEKFLLSMNPGGWLQRIAPPGAGR